MRTREYIALTFLALVSLICLQVSGYDRKIGQEISVPSHLQDGEEYEIGLPALIAHGGKLFNAMWTSQEGGGRPRKF